MIEKRYDEDVKRGIECDIAGLNALLDGGWELRAVAPVSAIQNTQDGPTLVTHFGYFLVKRLPTQDVPNVTNTSNASPAQAPVALTPLDKAIISAGNTVWRAYPKSATDQERILKGKTLPGFGFINLKEGGPNPESASLISYLKANGNKAIIDGWKYELNEEKGLINREPVKK